ncbi:cyclic nucleotide-binding domain-containing protein [Lutispora saccharofermentans]|uniref:Cyclic nucleotide-binding domain-containing protein n=1 Tax=Lutispora saccharofermentans TaxID=3024236 RepID=A0ABT1NFM2_9FIRM|nr:cyclic nucleotide-binding domain-containing protein [Lutispora saccharofermentans]MCQ1530047.1 cyclic nucleotide-binding domain-containing protein [Lutispora saccharofermentans]
MKLLNDLSLTNNYIDRFKLNNIFQQDMSQFMKLFLCEKGELICRINDELEWFYFVLKGKIKIYSSQENGKSILLRFYTPLSVIGDLELLKGYRVKANVEALTEVTLMGIKMKDIRDHAYDDSVFLRFVIENLSHKLYTLSNVATLNQSYPFVNRFASYLVSVTSDENRNKLADEIKTNNLTELATFLGVSYRHLNRVIKDLCTEGIIEKTKEGMIILDYKRLKRLSGGYYE